MKHIAIFYTSKEGQTERIASRIATSLREEAQVWVTLQNIADIKGDVAWDSYQGVIIGGSVRREHHSSDLVDFVIKNRMTLNSLPSAFYSVSLSAAGDPESKDDAIRMVDNFIDETDWMPDQIEIFAGALLYRQYNIFVRWIMKMIVKKSGGDTDTSRNYEYTNWDRVNNFAHGYLEEHFA